MVQVVEPDSGAKDDAVRPRRALPTISPFRRSTSRRKREKHLVEKGQPVMKYESPELLVAGKMSDIVQAQVVGGDDGHPPLKNQIPVITKLEEE